MDVKRLLGHQIVHHALDLVLQQWEGGGGAWWGPLWSEQDVGRQEMREDATQECGGWGG